MISGSKGHRDRCPLDTQLWGLEFNLQLTRLREAGGCTHWFPYREFPAFEPTHLSAVDRSEGNPRITRPSTRTWAAHTEAQPAFHSTVPCTGSPTAQNGCTETQGCRNACCTLSEPRVGSGPRDSVGGASGPLVFPSWAEGPRLCD